MRVAYSINHAPEELLAKHPNPALHSCSSGAVYLFCESLEEATGNPAINIINVAAMGLQADDAEDFVEGVLTESALTTMVIELLTGNQSGSEVWLAPNQYHFLQRTLFKTVEISQ